ncbi:MAG: AmmeMemoRadiSam system protein B [Bacteroidetes bacterium]|nr:AmmeMemoRadiSam system protein B [Bacteroidota bacterium]
MKKNRFYHYLFVVFYFSVISCTSQNRPETSLQKLHQYDRPAAFAGQFYPLNKEELVQMLEDLFDQAESKKCQNVIAIVSPHAGFIFSGKVAASGFNQIEAGKVYENIFIIGSSHTTWFEGASVYSAGDFITPLGQVNVNINLAEKLIEENEIFKFSQTAHALEHSIEVQLPFLQYILKEGFQIVPIILGTQSKEDCRKIARALKPFFTESNLFIISSDFSHYPDYKDAVRLDKDVAQSILINNAKLFLKENSDGSKLKTPGLSTRACGWTSILTLLYLTDHNDDFSYEFIDYKNSGDCEYGDTTRVVGYNSIAVIKNQKKSTGFIISRQESEKLIKIARNTIETYISGQIIPDLKPEDYPEVLKTCCGGFVTLKKQGQLRGCIGRFEATEPLYLTVQQMAIAASTQDMRFEPVLKNELKDLNIEVSVLTPLRKIESIEEIVLGKHGIYIKKGNRTGTFLPQVANETGWNLNEFLGHCSRDKAGIGWNGWKEAEIYIYEAIVISESSGH